MNGRENKKLQKKWRTKVQRERDNKGTKSAVSEKEEESNLWVWKAVMIRSRSFTAFG